MVNISELEDLLSSSSLQQIESSIADKISCDLYKDNISLLTGFIKEEVEASKLSVKVIERFLDSNSEEVINFGLKFLEKTKPQSLSTGIAITYSVYLIYLKDREEKELLEYLQKRRIPKSQKLLEQLLSIKKGMNL
jgi:hypothetical protein